MKAHGASSIDVKPLRVMWSFLSTCSCVCNVQVGFLPLHRSNDAGQEDPQLFAFLAFKAELAPGVELRNSGETDINVSGNSDPQALANAVVRILKDRGQVCHRCLVTGGVAASAGSAAGHLWLISDCVPHAVLYRLL
jgi:hypothetical protein